MSMQPGFSPEQRALFEAADFTWQRRGIATTTGMPFGEETVTETILLDLKLKYPGHLEIIPFSKPQEGKIGADWEWCFASQDHQFFERMLVQAKVLDDPQHEYAHIDRKIGNTGVRQIDKLIESAEQRGISAIYAFYNHLSDEGRLPSNCGTIGYAHPNPLPPCWGVSVALAEAVLHALPDKSFDTLSARSMPLHCLLCSGGSGRRSPSGSPGSLAAALQRLRTEPDVGTRFLSPSGEPSRRPPDYFEAASRFGSLEAIERERVREKLARDNPDIDGIALFIDGDEQKPITPKRMKPVPEALRAAPSTPRLRRKPR